MNSFQSFVKALGGMHDSLVLRIEVDAPKGKLTIELDDIYQNFQGLPEYLGITPATIILSGLQRLSMGLQVGTASQIQKLHIDEFVVQNPANEASLAEIKFWPEGFIKSEFVDVTVESAGKWLWPPTATK